MHARPHPHDDDIAGSGRGDPCDLLRAASSLRDQARASTASIRELLRGHVELDDEVHEPEEARDGQYWRHEAERIRDEIDQLVGLYEAASHGRGATRSRPVARRRPAASRRPPERDDFMKKAFMFLMLTELM